MRRVVAPLVAVVLALSLAACGSDDDDDDDVSAATTTTTEDEATTTTAADTMTTVPAPPTTAPEACQPGTPQAGAVTGGTPVPGMLTDVIVESDGCVDAINFVFAASVPGFSVEYQPGPFVQDGSGAPVTVAGAAFLVIRMEPAYSYDFESSMPTYSGPRELMPTGANWIAEVENTGDFEAVMTWVIGVDEQAAFGATVDGDSILVTIGSPG